MLVSEVISNVREELNASSSTGFWDDTQLLALVDRGQKDYARRTRVFETDHRLDTNNGQEEYTLPADWISARKVFVQDTNDEWSPLAPTNLERMSQEHPGFLSTNASTFGVPEEYWVDTEDIHFYPTPSGNLTIKMYYVAETPTLPDTTASLSIPNELAEGVVEYVLWKAFLKDQEPESAAEHKANYYEMVGQGHAWIKRRQLDQRNSIDQIIPNRTTRKWNPLE